MQQAAFRYGLTGAGRQVRRIGVSANDLDRARQDHIDVLARRTGFYDHVGTQIGTSTIASHHGRIARGTGEEGEHVVAGAADKDIVAGAGHQCAAARGRRHHRTDRGEAVHVQLVAAGLEVVDPVRREAVHHGIIEAIRGKRQIGDDGVLRFKFIVVESDQVAGRIVNLQDCVELVAIAGQNFRHHLEIHQVALMADERIIIVRALARVGIDINGADHILSGDTQRLAVVESSRLEGVGNRQAGKASQGLGAGKGLVRTRLRVHRGAGVVEGKADRLSFA